MGMGSWGHRNYPYGLVAPKSSKALFFLWMSFQKTLSGEYFILQLKTSFINIIFWINDDMINYKYSFLSKSVGK